MKKNCSQFSLDLVHIDVARNATDDFNLFHDKNNWNKIVNNPFGGPIALGFQLECFIENYVNQYRHQNNEHETIAKHKLDYSNYAFNFVGVVRPNESLQVTVKKSRLSQHENTVLSNRVVLKNTQGIVILGFKSESCSPLFANDIHFDANQITEEIRDRSILDKYGYFYKQKFSTNSNAKNFLTGSHVEQSDYFDEANDKILFPETYFTSLISCALLERAKAIGHDFKSEPMVYTSHKISVNRNTVAKIRSDQKIHIVVSQPQLNPDPKEQVPALVTHYCFGFDQEKNILFQGEIQLAPLAYILAGNKN